MKRLRQLAGSAVAALAFVTPGWPAGGAPPVRAAVVSQDTSGKAIFTGKGNCHVCHGVDAKGTPLAPNLTDKEWLNVDGSLEAIVKTIKTGIASPKKAEHTTPMPPMGGAQLTDGEVQAVAKYVFALSHPAK